MLFLICPLSVTLPQFKSLKPSVVKLCGSHTWALTFWWGMMHPGLHITIPLLMSSLFRPRTRAPRLSPASARSRDLWNISIPAPKKNKNKQIQIKGMHTSRYISFASCHVLSMISYLNIIGGSSPVTTDLKLRLWPTNSQSSPFLMTPLSRVPVTTVPLPATQAGTFRLKVHDAFALRSETESEICNLLTANW